MEVQKGIHDLPQASTLAHDLLIQKLACHGYSPCPMTIGLWKHQTKDIAFVLTDNYFGIKYIGKDNAHHLINELQLYYELSINRSGDRSC